MVKKSDPRTAQPDADQIRELRRQHGWSQLDLLNKIVELNGGKELLTLKTIENVEKGRPCFYQTIRFIAQALEVAPGSLARSNKGASVPDSKPDNSEGLRQSGVEQIDQQTDKLSPQ